MRHSSTASKACAVFDAVKEIGSEFWKIPVYNQENGIFPAHTNWFLSGRCALQAIIRDWGGKSIALPSWLCESMIKPFLDAGVTVEFYPALEPIRNIRAEGILIMDYFGYVRPLDMESYDGTIIRDVTHSVFSKEYKDADYYFGSLRKWAGFWTGGYAWTKDGRVLPIENGDDHGYTPLRKQAMEEKAAYMEAGAGEKVFLGTFGKADEVLEDCGALPADARDIALAKQLDVTLIRERRRANAARLLQSLADIAVFPELGKQDCPLFVPVCLPKEERDALRKALISQAVYCPVHWPRSVYHTAGTETCKLYETELSLVCDQRYTVEDMERIIEIVQAFRKE